MAMRHDSVFARRVTTGASTMHLWSLVDLVERGDLDLNPPYQRGLVWSLEQKKALISTILSGLNIPSLYIRQFDDQREGPWQEVVDGKQRLSTLIAFMRDEFTYAGQAFSEWRSVDQDIFRNTFISAVTLYDVSDEDALTIYERINFNGTPQVAGDDILRFMADNGVTFTARILRKGDRHGAGLALTYQDDRPQIEFYDFRYVERFTRFGQFVSSYYVDTFLHGFNETMVASPGGFCLHGGVDSWSIDGYSYALVVGWLKGRLGP